jgi:hypothetical protein
MNIRRTLTIFIALLSASACAPAVDRCTADPNLPDCRADQAVANATIVAANSNAAAREREAFMQTTRDAVALHAQATQGAINARATAEVVAADATRSVMNLNAQATQSAINTRATAEVMAAQATRSAIEIEALKASLNQTATLQAAQFKIVTTQAALEGEARVRAATVEADAAGVRAWLLIGTALFAIVMTVASVVWYINRSGRAVAHAALVKASLRFYGPQNSRAVLAMPGKDGTIDVKHIDPTLDFLREWLPRLNVPDQQKLLAIVDHSRRSAVIDGVGLSGIWPLLESDEPEPVSQLSAPLTAAYPYQIVTPSATGQPMTAWLDEVETRLIGAPNGG